LSDAHKKPGCRIWFLSRLAQLWVHSAFTHHLSIGELLAITQTLYARCPAAWLLSVRGYAFEFSQELSPQTQALARQAAEMLYTHLIGEASALNSKPEKE